MPRLSQSIPKYRKHRGSGQAVVTLGGRDHYLGPHGSRPSKAEYDRLVMEWLSAGRTVASTRHAVTVVEVIAAFMKWGKTHYRDADGNVTGSLANFKFAFGELRRLYGRTPAADFGPLSLESLQMAYVKQGLSRRTVNDRVACVRRMFKWAVSKELVPASLHHSLQSVAGLQRGRTAARESVPVRPVDEATVESTIVKLPATVADMVRLQLLTGMRPAEVCIIRPQDTDRNSDVWLYRPRKHKTEHHGKERIIAIGPRGQDVLRKYLTRPSEAHCFSPAESERTRRLEQQFKRTTPLNTGSRPGGTRTRKPKRPAGACYTTESYRRAIQRAAKSAGVEHWHPNQLRHSAGTRVRREFGLEAAQVILGHSTADVTQIYAERNLSLAVLVARKSG